MKRYVYDLLRSAAERPRHVNLAVESLIFVTAGVCAFLLRFDFRVPEYYLRHLYTAIPLWLVLKLVVFHVAGLDRRTWKFFSVSDAITLFAANAIGTVLATMLLYVTAPPGFPRSIPAIDFLLCLSGTSITFLARRAVEEIHTGRKRVQSGKNVVVYGAGRAGVALATELKNNPSLSLNIVGFIDDNPAIRNMLVYGIRVLGGGERLAELVRQNGIEEVLIAAPSATGEQMLAILGACQESGVRFRTMATMSEIVEGKALASQMRDVDVQDLLCRTPIRLNHDQIRTQIERQVVMISGAAGSIGSELCRQIARFRPSAIVGFDIAESALFHIDREIRASFPDVPFHPEIGSIRDRERIAAVMAEHQPSIVFHAAAYKHVPMMERTIFEAIRNNAFGTKNLADVAEEFNVDRFVLISSDKAVRPTNVMGATKRLCELQLLSRNRRHTIFSAVRFGNVLGSNGSVIPLFKEQIRNGGPVTVTHPEMRRYFMTIPEAAQLVVQAGCMANGGEIFVLDMGEQIKIVDLARNLILLSGLRPDVDIHIRFTGTRPGEKLFEELNLEDEETRQTHHPKIKIFTGTSDTTGLTQHMYDLDRCCEAQNARQAVLLLKEIIPEYNPSNFLLRQILDIDPVPDAPSNLRQQGPRVRSLARGA